MKNLHAELAKSLYFDFMSRPEWLGSLSENQLPTLLEFLEESFHQHIEIACTVMRRDRVAANRYINLARAIIALMRALQSSEQRIGDDLTMYFRDN